MLTSCSYVGKNSTNQHSVDVLILQYIYMSFISILNFSYFLEIYIIFFIHVPYLIEMVLKVQKYKYIMIHTYTIMHQKVVKGVEIKDTAQIVKLYYSTKRNAR